MTKKIVINTCLGCPYRGYRGDTLKYGKIAEIPRCERAYKWLPYETNLTFINNRAVTTATPTGKIPDWCPLEDN